MNNQTVILLKMVLIIRMFIFIIMHRSVHTYEAKSTCNFVRHDKVNSTPGDKTETSLIHVSTQLCNTSMSILFTN